MEVSWTVIQSLLLLQSRRKETSPLKEHAWFQFTLLDFYKFQEVVVWQTFLIFGEHKHRSRFVTDDTDQF